MKENYYGTSNFQNNISIYNPEKQSFLSNNTFTNSLSFEGNKTSTNTDESLGFEELPPMEEDVDHLKKFHLENRNNIYHFNNLNSNNNLNQYKNSTRSYSVKNNNLSNSFNFKLPTKRETATFYIDKPNKIKPNIESNKAIVRFEKPPMGSLQSRYSSASENKYHFTHKLALNPQLNMNNTLSGNITRVNYAPINTLKTYINNTINNNSDSKFFYNNDINSNLEQLYSNKTQSQFSTPQTPKQSLLPVNNNSIQNKQFEVRENRFKQTSDYGYRTVDTRKLQKNIAMVKMNDENKSAQYQSKNLNLNNKPTSGFDLIGDTTNNNTNTNTNNYYQNIKNQFPINQIKIPNYQNDQRYTTIPTTNIQLNNTTDLGNQRNTYYETNPNKYIDTFYNIKIAQPITLPKNNINNTNFNKTMQNIQLPKKEPEIAVVTKINDQYNNIVNPNNYFYGQYNTGVTAVDKNLNIINNQTMKNNNPKLNNNNNNININFIQNNINNINIKNQNDLIPKTQPTNNYITQDIEKLINENLAQYIKENPQPKSTPYIQPIQTVPSNIQKPKINPVQTPKLVSAYRTATNTVITNHNFNPQNINNLNIFQNQIQKQNQNQAQPRDNIKNANYINYNSYKPESERATIINDKIQTPKKVEKKKDIDVTYSDFDGTGFVKNYGGVSRPGKDSSGQQKTNQDALVCKTNINNIKDFNIFGVLDGHGPEGHFVSEFAAEFIPSQIVDHPEIKSLKDPQQIYLKLKENNCNIITQAFINADEQLKTVDFDTLESGSTCCLIIHVGTHIICANSGDSRALVVYDHPGNMNTKNYNLWNVTPLSLDYKPEIPEERNRIVMSGGVVEQMKDEFGDGCGPYRVWVKGKDYPGLAMSRSIGDLKGKEVGVIPNPGILEYDLNKSTRFVIACSDGVFEFINNQTVMDFGKRFYLKNDASAYCHELVKQALLEWETNDNIVDDITAVVAFF